MPTLALARAMLMADALNVGRDPLLRWLVVIPLALAAATRWLLPGPVARIGALLQVDLLVVVYPTIMSYAVLLLAPALGGLVVGFLLLDQRDDRTLTALRVTPLPLPAYLAYRLAGPSLVSLVTTLVAVPLSGLADLSPLALALVALVAAPLAPLTALSLAAFAANKVQGFALQKLLGLAMIAPLIGSWLPWPWAWLVGLVPTAWPVALWRAYQVGTADPWPLLLGGLAYQGLLLVLLVRRLLTVLARGCWRLDWPWLMESRGRALEGGDRGSAPSQVGQLLGALAQDGQPAGAYS